MSRIRFFSAQIYETSAPGKGPQFPAGFVLDARDVSELLRVEHPSPEFAASFLRRWVNRNLAEYVGDDVDASDLSEVVYVDPGKRVSVSQPFGMAKHGRPAAGVDGDGAASLSTLNRADLDKLAAERGVDITEAKNKADVIALLQAAEKPAE